MFLNVPRNFFFSKKKSEKNQETGNKKNQNFYLALKVVSKEQVRLSDENDQFWTFLRFSSAFTDCPHKSLLKYDSQNPE